MIKDEIVKINNEDYVLWYTEDEYDIETCVHATPKKDFNKVMQQYENADCFIYTHNIFIYDGKKFKKMVKEWTEEND